MALPNIELPSLRAFLGAIALSKTTAVTAVRALRKLQGGLTQNDVDVRDVVNALIDAFDTSAASPGPIGATTPAAGTFTTLTALSLLLRAVAGSSKSESQYLQKEVSTTNTTATPIYTWSSSGMTNSTIRIHATIVGVRDDGSDDYSVDVVYTYRVSGGFSFAGLALTKSNEKAASGGACNVSLTGDGITNNLNVVGLGSQNWRWSARIRTVTRTVTA